jgi:hypothetical protein
MASQVLAAAATIKHPRGVNLVLKKQYPIGAVLGVLLFLVASERPAHAYTDPGSGMLIWQGLVAAFLGASFYFRKFFFKFFGKKSTDDKPE